jgi:hypothetical protein
VRKPEGKQDERITRRGNPGSQLLGGAAGQRARKLSFLSLPVEGEGFGLLLSFLAAVSLSQSINAQSDGTVRCDAIRCDTIRWCCWPPLLH